MDTKILPGVLALFLTLSASGQALASFDDDSCRWGTEGCVLEGTPVLEPKNDTRDNLLRLLSEQKSFPLPIQTVPADVTRSRQFWFGRHPVPWEERPGYTAPAPEMLSEILADLLTRLDLTLPADASRENKNELENRFVSLTGESDVRFLTALLADATLTPEQRRALAQARLALNASDDARKKIDALDFPADTTAQQFRFYLTACRAFYLGDYATAQQIFSALKTIQQPWLAETASYMLIRTALNRSTQNASGSYGQFEVTKVDTAAAAEARQWAEKYLQQWPQGEYASSATGLLRRINWYLQEWDTLAALYEQAFARAATSDDIIRLVAENDSKLQSKEMTGDGPLFLSAPGAPLITFTQTLRLMRDIRCEDGKVCVDEAYLQQLKPIFEQHQMLPYWHYLHQMLAWSKGEYQSLIDSIAPAATLPQNTILAFSSLVLRGNALMAQKRWPEAQTHWSRLIAASAGGEQRQYLQSQLAATLVDAGEPAAIFAKNSLVTSLRYRSAVLKTKASPALLRQQASGGPNNEERTIALHTLLVRDLLDGRYDDWLNDRKLISAITQPVIGEQFADVNLSTFDWTGDNTEPGYVCRSLEHTVRALSRNARDGHAINCLAEFFRTTETQIDLSIDSRGNNALSVAISDPHFTGRPNRLAYYEQLIADSKAEPEDKSYALYRAIMCYAPSGYNHCGSGDVEQRKRKGWFTQLKTQYPGTPWAQQLPYYW